MTLDPVALTTVFQQHVMSQSLLQNQQGKMTLSAPEGSKCVLESSTTKEQGSDDSVRQGQESVVSIPRLYLSSPDTRFAVHIHILILVIDESNSSAIQSWKLGPLTVTTT